jgi:hypothetical protein
VSNTAEIENNEMSLPRDEPSEMGIAQSIAATAMALKFLFFMTFSCSGESIVRFWIVGQDEKPSWQREKVTCAAVQWTAYVPHI